MRAFKFVHPRDAHYLERFSLLIGSSSSYAALEDQRVDNLEGRVSHVVEDLRIGPNHPAQRAERAFLDDVFGPRDPNARQVLRNVEVIHDSPPFGVLCLARTHDNRHWLENGYSVVYEIPDAWALAHWLRSRYSALLGRPHVAPVEYRDRKFQLPHGMNERAHIFVKRPEYAPEDEIRIAWPALKRPFVALSASLIPTYGLIRRISG